MVIRYCTMTSKHLKALRSRRLDVLAFMRMGIYRRVHIQIRPGCIGIGEAAFSLERMAVKQFLKNCVWFPKISTHLMTSNSLEDGMII